MNRPRLQFLADWNDENTEAELLAKVDDSRPGMCRAHYWIGISYLGLGDDAAAAGHFAMCIESGQFYKLDTYMARAFLTEIERQDRAESEQ